MTNKLYELAWKLVRAQGRMLDKWSEGDEAVKNGLWEALHKAGDEFREYLTATPQPRKGTGRKRRRTASL